jgi:hypothetical protein
MRSLPRRDGNSTCSTHPKPLLTEGKITWKLCGQVLGILDSFPFRFLYPTTHWKT